MTKENQNREWTIEDLNAKHQSRPYNPLIASAFFRMGMIEPCRLAGKPQPILRYNLGGLWIEFTSPITNHLILKAKEKNNRTSSEIWHCCSKKDWNNPTNWHNQNWILES